MSKLKKKSREVMKVPIMWSPVNHCKKFSYYAAGMESHCMDLNRGVNYLTNIFKGSLWL